MTFCKLKHFASVIMLFAMKTSTLEHVANKWTFAHTVALAAWVVVLVLGLQLYWQHIRDAYPATDKLKIYAAENATFMYPVNWQINQCGSGKPFIELPGTIKAKYKGRQAYQFTMYGTGSYACVKGAPERLDIYSETIAASDHPCVTATSPRGERLQNGLYIQLDESGDEVFGVSIRQNSCFVPGDMFVLRFAFTDPEAEPGDAEKYGSTRINKQDFLASRQYQDIQALAESIR